MNAPTAQSTRECSNGLAGYESDEVCCPLSCGSCGGDDCQGLGDGCCASDVKETGVLCSEAREAPCFMDGESKKVELTLGRAIRQINLSQHI